MNLRGDNTWLTVAGLIFLKPGKNTFGAGPLNIVLPEGADATAWRAGVRSRHGPPRGKEACWFTGPKWFGANDAFRVSARFEPYPSPKRVRVANLLGDLDPFDATGLVAFTLNGMTYRLEVYDVGAGDEPLFIVFKDLTSGRETYPAARFLNAARPNAKRETVLDFNKAYNPPCA